MGHMAQHTYYGNHHKMCSEEPIGQFQPVSVWGWPWPDSPVSHAYAYDMHMRVCTCGTQAGPGALVVLTGSYAYTYEQLCTTS